MNIKTRYARDQGSKPADGESELNAGLASVRKQLNMQGQNGNWNYDPYMQGMYNGLECALATLEGRKPEYKSVPDKWLCDIPSNGAPIEAANVKLTGSALLRSPG